MASYRPGGSGGLRADLELTGEQVLHSLVVHDHHYEVDAFHSNLQTPAAAAHGEERRRTPAFRGAARGNSLPMFRSKHKSALHHVGNYRYALGALNDFGGNPLSG